jgi:hypothetical protein
LHNALKAYNDHLVFFIRIRKLFLNFPVACPFDADAIGGRGRWKALNRPNDGDTGIDRENRSGDGSVFQGTGRQGGHIFNSGVGGQGGKRGF